MKGLVGGFGPGLPAPIKSGPADVAGSFTFQIVDRHFCRQWLRAGLARHALPLHHATTRHPSRVLTGAVWP